MNRREPSVRHLEQLFQDLEDGTLTADDHASLMSLMRSREDIRRKYLQHMTLATGLHDLAEAWGADRADDETEPIARREQRRMWRQSFLAAAALIAIMASIGSLIAIRSKAAPPVSATAGVATIWRFASGGISEGGNFMRGTRVQVDQGTVELTTRSRSRIVIEGPASYEIHDDRYGSLSSGKAWFDISPKDKTFTVRTEHLRVIDLGTSFGIATSPSSDRIQVDTGRVLLKSRFPGIATMELGAGQAAVANLVGRCQRAPFDPGLFIRELPAEPVVIHWSFDEAVDDQFPSEAQGVGEFPMDVRDFDQNRREPTLVAGRFGAALDLTSGDVFAESNFPGVSGSGPRSVAFWIRSTPIARRSKDGGTEYTPSVLTWGDPWSDGSYWSIRAHTLSGMVATQWDDTAWFIGGKYESPGILDDQWHHIASVYTGGMDEDGHLDIRHYIDGKRVANLWRILGPGIDTRADADPSSNLRLAYDVESPGGPANVPIAIDELHIVRGILTDEQIESLFLENRIIPDR